MPNHSPQMQRTGRRHYTDGMIDNRRGFGVILLILIPISVIVVIIFGIIKTTRTQEFLPYGESTVDHGQPAPMPHGQSPK